MFSKYLEISTTCDVCGRVNCTTCVKSVIRELTYGKDYHRRKEATLKLGATCVCCGSKRKLQIDHILPLGRKLNSKERAQERTNVVSEIFEGKTEKYQVLCSNCNRWKDNGPQCPCKWWDSISPEWRKVV